MKYVFLIQLLIITIITMFTSANVLKNKTYLKNIFAIYWLYLPFLTINSHKNTCS